MAIVINSDGTVSTIETTHDQYGNIRPKMPTDNSTVAVESVSKRGTTKHDKKNSPQQRDKHTFYPTEYASRPKVKINSNNPQSPIPNPHYIFYFNNIF